MKIKINAWQEITSTSDTEWFGIKMTNFFLRIPTVRSEYNNYPFFYFQGKNIFVPNPGISAIDSSVKSCTNNTKVMK